MAATTTNPSISQILKEWYLEPLRSSVNNESMVETMTTKEKQETGGNTAVVAIHSGRNSGVGYGEQSGTAPTAGSQQYFRVTVPTKKIWGRWRVSAEVEAASRSTRGAFANVMKKEMTHLKDDIVDVSNKHFVLDGTGKLAVPKAPFGPGVVITLSDYRDAIYFEEGMSIDIYDTVAVAFIATARTVSAVFFGSSTVDSTVTVTGANFTTNANCKVTLAKSIADGTADNVIGTSLAMQGLDSIVNTTTLFGVDPSVQPKFKAFNGNSLVPASPDNLFIEANLEIMLDNLKVFGNGKIPDVILTSYTQIRQYKKDITNRERRQVDTIDMKSGRKGAIAYEYEGKKIALVPDRYVRNGITYGWVIDHLVLYESRQLDWHVVNGNLLLQVPGTTMVEAIIYGLQELAPRIRNAMLRVTNWSQVG